MKKILVVGAGEYQTTLIKRIIELGHEAYAVDYNKNAVGFGYATGYKVIDIMDKDACLLYAKELCIDAVMTYGATISLPTVAYIAKNLGLRALPEYTAEISKSKYKIKKRLAEAGLNVKGDFFEMYSKEDAEKRTFTYPCVIKPSDGSGSKGVSLVNDEKELPLAIDYAFDSARFGEVYCEGFVDGEEYSAEVFVCGDEVYVYAIVKTTFERNGSENDGISYGHRTPSGLGVEAKTLIEEEVKKAVKALGINMCSVNFDVILSNDDGKPYIIDCGIRIGQNLIASHLVPLSRGVSVIDNTVGLALGEDVDAEPKFEKCVATRLLIYTPGVIQNIKDMSEVIGKNGVLDVVMRKKVGDIQRVYTDKSDNCGWVIAEGNTPDEAEANAEAARKVLRDYIVITPTEE